MNCDMVQVISGNTIRMEVTFRNLVDDELIDMDTLTFSIYEGDQDILVDNVNAIGNFISTGKYFYEYTTENITGRRKYTYEFKGMVGTRTFIIREIFKVNFV